MYYGDEKKKEIMRSILPSKWAKGAREGKRDLNKKVRRTAKNALRHIRDAEDWDDSSFDFWDDGQDERSSIVWNRRGADKLSHFMRWAEHTAKDIPDGEKMGYIKGLLPGKGVIFDHACGHLEHLDGFDSDTYIWSSYWRRRDKDVLSRADLIRLLEKVCEVRKFHGYLNDAIKKRHKKTYWRRVLRIEEYNHYKTARIGGEIVKVSPPEVRVRYHTDSQDKTIAPRQLMGMYDVENFVDDIICVSKCKEWIDKSGYRSRVRNPNVRYSWEQGSYRFMDGKVPNPDYHPEWIETVKYFIEDFLKNTHKLKGFSVFTSFRRRTYDWENSDPRRSKFVWRTDRVKRSYVYDWKL